MTAPRITVPTLFDGNWDSVLICTYGANLNFYERDLWRQLERARNRVVFADGRQIARKLIQPEDRGTLRQVNRTYVLAPMQVDHAAHAKLILLLRDDRGLLAVGSGNLGMDGYASQGECFTTYRWSAESPDHLEAFIAAKEFLGAILDRGLVDEVVRPRVQQAWQDAPWIYGPAPAGTGTVRHNFDEPLLDQFIGAVNDRPVAELVVHAPFYDHQCRALSTLIARAAPQRLQILLQERITSVDPKRLQQVLASADCAIDVRSVEASEKGTFLHAKFLIARCDDVSVCLQGSPNLSTPALLETFPSGNIELANLLIGEPGEFDHLVSDLVVSHTSVDVAGLGLELVKDDGPTDDEVPHRCVRELVWVSPRLSGVFDQPTRTPPALVIGEVTVDDVHWDLDEPADNTTRFTATLGERSAGLLSRVEAVTFVFDSGYPSAPVYPYHLNTLIALASGQGRTDLLKQAGDFEIGDEELEQLLAQLDEVLVVDGHSIWRMLKRKAPEPNDAGEPTALSYDDLDWAAIQSHPKLAQYRSWDHQGATDLTGLGILLNSIAERFQADVQRRRLGELASAAPVSEAPTLEDLSLTPQSEDEQTAEADEDATERRRLSARTRAKRQFHSFVRRFVAGIIDEDFVRLVGPSVIVPSYVVFNHLCWKLIQVELADPLQTIEAQSALWRFFWGEPGQPGYLNSMSTDEQTAALEILDRHHAEAVLLCSMFQAYDVTWRDGAEKDVAAVRDAWRHILNHPLWQPTRDAVLDAATIAAPSTLTSEELVEELESLASFTTEREPLQILERALGARSDMVTTTEALIHRGDLGDRVSTIYRVEDPTAELSPATATLALQGLRAVLSEPAADYIRIEHPAANTIAFADYTTNDFLYADRSSSDIIELERPEPAELSWHQGLDDLYELAG